MENTEYCYLRVKSHGILGGLVEFWVLKHVFFPTGPFKYSKSEWWKSSEYLHEKITERESDKSKIHSHFIIFHTNISIFNK